MNAWPATLFDDGHGIAPHKVSGGPSEGEFHWIDGCRHRQRQTLRRKT